MSATDTTTVAAAEIEAAAEIATDTTSVAEAETAAETVTDTTTAAETSTDAAAEKAPLVTAAEMNEPINPLNKSYESMDSQEIEEPHYNLDSDGEPPQDEIGDKLTVVHKR